MSFLGCQKQIAKEIVEQKGHYCLAVKTNQAILYEEIKDYFSYAEKEEPERLSTYQTIEKDYGRIEKRKYLISRKIKEKKAMQNLSLIRKICYNLMKLDKRFDKK